jgi:dimethylargininase
MGERPTLDVARARMQHAAYRSLLAFSGYEVHLLAGDEQHPDCPFVEDAAFVLDSLAIATRPGAPERRGEVAPVAAALASMMPVHTIAEPGTIDGGDVLRLGSTVFVGLSSRTNRNAIDQLVEMAAHDNLSVVGVPVAGVLHLKSAVAALDEETVLIAPGCVDGSFFSSYRRIEKVPGEEHLASVLRLRTGVLAVTTTAPQTTERITDAGFEVTIADSSEFQAADGGLTCLSILIDR